MCVVCGVAVGFTGWEKLPETLGCGEEGGEVCGHFVVEVGFVELELRRQVGQ